MGQWPQLVCQVAIVLIRPNAVSPLSSLRYPLSKLFTKPSFMPCFSHSQTLFFCSKHKIIGLFSLKILLGLTFVSFSNVCISAFVAAIPPTCFSSFFPFNTFEIFRNKKRRHLMLRWASFFQPKLHAFQIFPMYFTPYYPWFRYSFVITKSEDCKFWRSITCCYLSHLHLLSLSLSTKYTLTFLYLKINRTRFYCMHLLSTEIK